MTLHFKKSFISGFIVSFLSGASYAQGEKIWTLDECIQYAFSKNIQIQQAGLSEQQSQLYLDQAKASRLPSLSAGINKNFGWDKEQNSMTGEYGSLKGSNSTTYSLNSSIQLINGMKLNNQVKQANLNLLENQYYSETVKESVELNLLDAYLQVLYAKESVINSEKQVESTSQQLDLAKERLDLGIISKSDYFQIKSQLASEKLTLVNAQGDVNLAKLNLQQLMELPVSDSFFIVTPNLENLLTNQEIPSAGSVYQQALDIKPQIKQAQLNTQSAELETKIAKASLMPSLSLNAGLGTNYSSITDGYSYFEQLDNKFGPSVGLSLSIPIFQKKQASTSISLAKIGVNQAQLNEIETKNELRKSVEQASINVVTAQQQFEASQEDYAVTLESFEVATEKFNQGLMNSVDYLYEKTNLIISESQLLQSKYNLIFSYKVLDFYKGERITL